MSVTQFGSHYFDPADVVAIDTKPLVARRRDQEGNIYFVYLKRLDKPLLLIGDAAEECLEAFAGPQDAKEDAKEKKGTSKKEDKK